jgi:hypothetical protein
VRDAFQAMRRQLEDRENKRRQDVKHPVPAVQDPRIFKERPI